MIILNGKLYEPGSPEATLLNRSFRYGDGLFETLRVYNGKPLFTDLHLERMTRGMKALGFIFQPELFTQTILSEIQRVMEINGIENQGKVSVHIFRAGEGSYKPASRSPYYLIEGYSVKDDYFQSKVSCSLTEYKDISLNFNALSAYKTTNALPYVMAAMYAQDKGFDDAVLFCDGYVSETAGTNIFMVEKQKIFTPPLSSGCVDGIMRKQVIKLMRELKLNFAEKKLRSKDFLQADEIFLTNSVRGILPVRQWNEFLLEAKTYTFTPFLKNCLLQMIQSQTKK
ncbi:MAG: aminotransferase class IV [Bacteroidia bacterium]|nr:aminotransferase class IV [Bacteroidia bacterium]